MNGNTCTCVQQWESETTRRRSALIQVSTPILKVNGQTVELEVKQSSGADVQDSVVALLNQLGKEGWELVSHQERISEGGLMRGPTEYSLFLKRPR